MFRNRLMSVAEGKTVVSNDTVSSSQTDGVQKGSDIPNHRRQSVASTGHSHNGGGSLGGFGGAIKNANLGGGSMPALNPISPQHRPSISNTKGPSLVGLLASKRLAKQLSNRFLRRRYGSLCDSSKASLPPKKEPTYRMEPYRKFDSCKVEEVIKDVMDDRLRDFPYKPKLCANMSKVISDEIKGEVKMLNFDRYKIVCTVMIGQRLNQGVHVASRCAWNENLDNYSSYTFKNDNIFATAVVYGIYTD